MAELDSNGDSLALCSIITIIYSFNSKIVQFLVGYVKGLDFT